MTPHHALPFGVVDLEEAALAAGDAGIGEGAVDPAELGEGLGEGGVDRGAVGNVDLLRTDLAAGLRQPRFGGGVFLRVGAPDADVGARLRHRLAEAEADAAVAAGDERDFSGQVERLVHGGLPAMKTRL